MSEMRNILSDFEIFTYSLIVSCVYIIYFDHAQIPLPSHGPPFPLNFFLGSPYTTLLFCSSDPLSLTGVAGMSMNVVLFTEVWQTCLWLNHRRKMTFPPLAATNSQYNSSLARCKASWAPRNEKYFGLIISSNSYLIFGLHALHKIIEFLKRKMYFKTSSSKSQSNSNNDKKSFIPQTYSLFLTSRKVIDIV